MEVTEQSFRRAWPDDLRRWYALQNGAAWDSANTPLPGWRILSLAEMRETAEMFGGFYADEEGLVAEGEADAAGAIASAFLPSFVPIGDNIAACYLFVDTRPGPSFGCVSDWDRDEGALDESTWPSVTAMLEDVAAAVRSGRACDGWIPTVVDGELTWELVQTPPNAWDTVSDLYLRWRELDYAHYKRTEFASGEMREWSLLATELAEEIAGVYAFHNHVPVHEWPDGLAERFRVETGRLRGAVATMPADARPYFEATVCVAEAALTAASQPDGRP